MVQSRARPVDPFRCTLEERGDLLPDADIQIAATSIHHGLSLVTGSLRHFERFEGLRLSAALADARHRA